MIGEQSQNKKQAWDIERPIRESIIDDINKVTFTQTKDEKGNLMLFKLIEPLEPVINISPFYLFYSAEKESLSVAYYNVDGIIGIQLTYPKYITWYDKEEPEILETSSFKSFDLFETLVARIKMKAKKAKLQSETKLFKPNFWISKEAVLLINTNKYLKENRLVIL